MQQTTTITRSPLWGRFDRDRRHLERQYAEPAYDPDTGLFQWNADATVEALEIMKRMMPLAGSMTPRNQSHPIIGAGDCRRYLQTNSVMASRMATAAVTIRFVARVGVMGYLIGGFRRVWRGWVRTSRDQPVDTHS